NEIAKEYDYLKDIYQEVERTKDGELVREIIPSISSDECFKLYNKLPFESINDENTKLNTNANEEVKKLEFELAKEAHALILEQQLLSATDYYSWIDKDDYASFAWKMHRLINENKLKENHLSADNANKIKQFFFNNGFILGWTKEEQSAIQENRDYSLRSALLSLEEIDQAKIELQKYYESVYVNGDGNQREIKPFKEILRDANNFEKAYKERYYDKLVSLNEAVIQAKEGGNERQNSNANNNNTIKNTIETNTSNNIIKNNDNNNPNLSVADLESEQQNLGEPNEKERTNRADEPNRIRAGIPQEIHRRSEHREQQEGVERSSDEDLSHQDPSLFIEPREQGGTRGIYRSSDQQAVSEKPHRERDRIHEHVSRGDGVSAKADTRADSNGASSPASRMENGARSEEKGDNPPNERGVSQTPQSSSHQQNSSRDLGLSLSRKQPGQIGRLRLFDHGQMGSLFPTDHENQRSKNDNEPDSSSDRANENGDKSPRQNGSANQESARSERYGIAPGSSNQSVLPLAQSRLHHAGLSTPNGLGNLEQNRDQKRGLLSNLGHLESLLNAIRNNTIASEPDFRSRLLEAIQNNEPLKDSIVGAQLLKDPTTKVFYDKFQLKISPKKVLEILENRLKKSIETANETLNAFNALDSQSIDLNAISNSVGLNPTQESKITDNSVELNNAQEQTAQEQDTQENAPTTIKQETPTPPAIPLNPKIDFKPSEEVLIKGAKTRYKANIKAIELLKELQAKQEILNGVYEVSIRSDELNELYGIRHKDKAHSYKAPFESLLNKVLNNKDLSVKYAQVDPNDPKKEIFITDEEQSNLARQKAEELKEAFKDWIYKDYARRTHLEQIYNDTFNNLVLKTYDGSQLELEGFNHHISLRPHQKNAIFRTIQDRAVCLDHQVGAGKTLCAIASCMEQKRMGLVNKTLIAVPNHLTKQWGDEFYKAYPNANVLVVDGKDITEKERELLFNQIANNNYDAVIIAHTHLELLSNPREIIEELKEEELVNAEKNFERQELAYKNNPRETKKPNERAFKNKLDKIRAKYDAILEKQGSHIDISQMGIDNLIVDEAHLFKNLAFETSMEKIAGLGNQQGSNRARDLFIKTRYLHQNDKKIMFLTGTPIANSLSEMYHLQRYLTPDVLKERGLEFFDDWAKTYGEVVNDFELDTSAQSYKMINRFSKFSDVQGLSTMYRAFADIVSNDDILKHNPHFVPKVYGDKPINVVVKRSEEVAQFIGVALENGKYNEGSIIDRMQKCEGK
ncbi:SNF2-related protein, partial [Helicobacter pylori]|uniref:SNF2-related protein n=1 Tax=Helicobacter pylori TaxID=210 RepID=UPI0036F34BEE